MLKRTPFFDFRYTSRAGLTVLAIAMLLLAAAGGFLSLRFSSAEKSRALLHWQVVLSLVSEERAAHIDGWFENKFESLNSLAQNVSLKLYLTELQLGDKSAEDSAPEYLRLLLEFTSGHAGFKPDVAPEALPNNAPFPRTAGLALLGRNKKMVASTRGMPPISGKLAEFVEKATDAPRQYLDLFTAADNNAPKVRMVAFLTPIHAVQGDELVGYALGVAEIGEAFFQQLQQQPLPYADAETLLVRATGGQIEYLTTSLLMDAATPNLDSADIVAREGGFIRANDYRQQEVLAFGVKLENAPWYVIHKVDAASALKESRERSSLMVSGVLLATLLSAALLFGVWRHASSLRAERAAREYRELARRHASHERLLRLITDTQLSSMFILDKDGTYRFVNAAGARAGKLSPAEMLGKRIDAVLGTSQANAYLKPAREALSSSATLSEMRRRKTEAGTTIYHTDYIPLPEIPDPYSAETRAGTLVVENDITPTILEKERRERILLNLVRTLTSVMDRVIPYCSNHSARVSRLARIIALEMALDRTLVRTVQFAGKLMNLGRIFLPKELFLKEGKLTPEELKQIHESIQLSAELLGQIEFDGPLTDTIRQSGEKMDGSGPLGLKGSAILLPARILTIANIFVGMVSNRAYRKSLTPEEALHALLQESGTKYDRSVVLALGNYLENRGGDTKWLLADSEEAE